MAGEARFIEIRVKPNAGVGSLQQKEDGRWYATLKAPPVDGKANEELIRLIAKHFGCSRSSITIKAGASGRTKLVKIDGA